MPGSIGLEVVRRATFYGDRVQAQNPSAITVIQQDYGHELVSLVSYRDDNVANVYRTGTPVMVEWGFLNQRVENFYGYVHHVEPMTMPATKPERRNIVKIVCIGATYPMQDSGRRVYINRTIPSVIEEILHTYKLSGEISYGPRVWDTLTQTDKSDWQFLCSLAQRLGWSVHPRGTNVIVTGRRMLNSTTQNTASVFVSPGPLAPPAGLGQIITFKSIDGETTPDGGQKANRTLRGIDPWQGTEFVAQMGPPEANLGLVNQAPLFSTAETDTARTYSEAVSRLAGISVANKWYLQAKAEVNGDPFVWPGKVVCLLGLNEKSNGYWYVQSAEHELSQGSYVLHLGLGRDAHWDHGLRPNTRRRRVVQPRRGAYGDIVLATPEAKLVAGGWRAAYGAPVA